MGFEKIPNFPPLTDQKATYINWVYMRILLYIEKKIRSKGFVFLGGFLNRRKSVFDNGSLYRREWWCGRFISFENKKKLISGKLVTIFPSLSRILSVCFKSY